ncbi:hypothetical protein QBC44DRAFT_400442 [Cladorrhinum sp. PSN332]|nr:hypothetical protein QBC44DRAFT_400442 [Cladorrhinum sp. PSN332]
MEEARKCNKVKALYFRLGTNQAAMGTRNICLEYAHITRLFTQIFPHLAAEQTHYRITSPDNAAYSITCAIMACFEVNGDDPNNLVTIYFGNGGDPVFGSLTQALPLMMLDIIVDKLANCFIILENCFDNGDEHRPLNLAGLNDFNQIDGSNIVQILSLWQTNPALNLQRPSIVKPIAEAIAEQAEPMITDADDLFRTVKDQWVTARDRARILFNTEVVGAGEVDNMKVLEQTEPEMTWLRGEGKNIAFQMNNLQRRMG